MRYSPLVMFFAGLVLVSGCGSPGGDAGERAVPTYCPVQYSSALPAAVSGQNSPPRAYYQSLSVNVGGSLDITLNACDPDLGTGYSGLSWAVTTGPINGGSLDPMSGTYTGSTYQATYTPFQLGTDSFVYHVNDGTTWSNTAEILINVLPVMTSFVVHGSGTVNEDSTSAYSASAVWSDGSVTAVSSGIAWAVTPTGFATISAGGVLTPVDVPPGNQDVQVQAQYSEPGGPVWQGSLTVTLGDTVTRLSSVAVNGPSSVDESSSASYAASAFFDDGSVTDVTSLSTWSVSPGTYASISGGTLTTSSVTSPQTVTVQASYIHSTGTQSGSVQVDINNNVIAPPTASITTYPSSGIDEGTLGIFAGNFSDPEGTGPYTYSWDFGDTGIGTGSSPNHTYADGPNTYTVTLAVTNGLALSDTNTVTVNVLNVAPNAVATADTLDTVVDQVILFDGSGSSDAGSDLLTYSWNFGDGSPVSTAVNPSHSYAGTGTYNVALTVTDDDGDTGGDSLQITVSPAVASTEVSLFFNRYETSPVKWELWSYNKAGGLSSHSNISTGLDPGVPVAFNGRLYFPGNDGIGDRQLWSWDGTNGLVSVATSNIWPDDLVVYRGQLYFSADDALLNRQLWSYNGISAPVQESFLTSGLQPTELIHFDGKLYFGGLVDLATGNQLWSYDLAGGLNTVTAVTGGLSPASFAIFPAQIDSVTWDTRLYFSGRNPANSLSQLYAFDAVNGLAQVSTVAGGMNDPPRSLIVQDGRLYYRGNPNGTATELWSYHPLEGYVQRTSISPSGLIPDFMTVYNGKLFLNGYDPTSGSLQLHDYDAVAGLNLAYGHAFGLNPRYSIVYDGDLYFNGLDVNDLLYLWSHDSPGSATTVAGTANLIYEDPVVFNPVNPPLGDASGTWSVNENATINSGPCVDYLDSFRAVITQRGSSLVINGKTTVNATITGGIGGMLEDRITGSRTYQEGVETTTEVFNLNLGSTGFNIFGSSSWTWTDGIDVCTGTSNYSGIKD